MADALEILQLLGLGEVEARLYLALLPQPPLTGYELAREAGVVRANVYPALQRLARRGAVMRQPGEGGNFKYAAVPYEQFLQRLRDEHDQTVEDARHMLSAVRTPERVTNGPLVARGYDNLIVGARQLCEEARRDLWLAVCPAEVAALSEAVGRARARGVALNTLCLTACPAPCGHCASPLVRAGFLSLGTGARWLFCLRDDEELLIGEIPENGEAQMTLTRQRPFLIAGAGFLCYAAALAERGETADPAPDSARFQAWLNLQ